VTAHSEHGDANSILQTEGLGEKELSRLIACAGSAALSFEGKVAELSTLPETEYMKARREVARTHEVPAGFLDREVAKRRPKPSKADYLSASKKPAAWFGGVVANPPYRYAQRFAERAFAEVPYVALPLRRNFLMDAEGRVCWLDRNEPTRVDYLLLRLPMKHREGWTGKRSSSNTPFSWVVWQEGAPREFPQRLLEGAARYQKAVLVTSASGMRFRARRDRISFRRAEGRAQGRSP
jgi:hypothetical protein